MKNPGELVQVDIDIKTEFNIMAVTSNIGVVTEVKEDGMVVHFETSNKNFSLGRFYPNLQIH